MRSFSRWVIEHERLLAALTIALVEAPVLGPFVFLILHSYEVRPAPAGEFLAALLVAFMTMSVVNWMIPKVEELFP